MTYAITGYEQDCNCDHCGRALKVGIQLSGYGVIGADCLNAALVHDRKRWGNGRPGAAYLRELAIKRQRNNDARIAQMGMTYAFRMNVKDGALNLN